MLFRAYPGPWCVFRRNPLNDELRLIWTSDTMPTLKQVSGWWWRCQRQAASEAGTAEQLHDFVPQPQVALEILPSNL